MGESFRPTRSVGTTRRQALFFEVSSWSLLISASPLDLARRLSTSR